MNSLPPIIVISLKWSLERRESVTRQMEKYGLDFTFFDAVDGSTLDINNEIFDHNYCSKTFNHPMNKGEYACAFSHVKAYEYIVKNNIDKAIILEDDIIINSEFKNIILKLADITPNSMELTYLYHGKAKSWPWRKKIGHNFKLARYIPQSETSKRLIIYAAAYILTLSGAKKLLQVAYPIRLPADYLLGCLQFNKLNTYGVEPPCLSLAGFKSDIDSVTKRNYGGHSND
ncbi:glycosyltransferase family 25 protein [Photobacterium kagoshimensis]|uniref:glycosyltransferase family 25 protein n=1 Tax=Photobacterium kagoshimensis TaxID=2910242 RepID=UPI003D0D3014